MRRISASKALAATLLIGLTALIGMGQVSNPVIFLGEAVSGVPANAILFNSSTTLGGSTKLTWNPEGDNSIGLRVGAGPNPIAGLAAGLQILNLTEATPQYFRSFSGQAVVTPTVDASYVWGLDFNISNDPLATRPIQLLGGVDVDAFTQGSGNVHELFGVRGVADNDVNSITVDDLFGVAGWAINYNNATITLLRGGYFYAEQNAGTVSVLRGADIHVNNIGGTVPLADGLRIRWSGANGYTTVHGLFIESMSGLTATTKQPINYNDTFIVDANGRLTVPAAGLTIGSGLVTLANSFTTSGNFALTLTQTATTNVTLPTTGTLATLAGSEAISNKTGNISQWTNDSGYLTSVTAHNVLSATHGDTLTASVVRGDVLVGNSTPKWSRLAKGTANQVLAMDGTATDVVWVTPSSGGTPGGSNTQVQYNNSSAFGGISGATTDGTTLTLVAPVLGAATATSINKVALTAPASSATLTILNGKTLTVNNTLILAGSDSTTMTFPSTSATIARTDAANTFTGVSTGTSWILTTPTISAWSSVAGTTLAGTATISAQGASAIAGTALTLTASAAIAGSSNVGAAAGGTIRLTAGAAARLTSGTSFGGDIDLITGAGIGGGASGLPGQVQVRNTSDRGNYSRPTLGIGGFGSVPGAVIGTGFEQDTGNTVSLVAVVSGGAYVGFGTNRLALERDLGLMWSGTASSVTAAADLTLLRAAAATLQLGADVNGAAVSQTLQAANGITGTDKTGGNFTLASGKGTGAGAVSSLIFQTPTVLTTGTTAQSLATRLTINSTSVTAATSFTGPKFLGNGTAPAVTNTSANSCGTTAATLVGSDVAGKVTVGATAGTSCTVTFTVAWGNAPSCTLSNESTANLARATSTTTTVVLAGTFAAGDVLAYQCLGY